VLGLAPVARVIETSDVDVPQSTAVCRRLAADEEEALTADRRRTKVVRHRVDRLAEVDRCTPGGIGARTPGDPDVEVRPRVPGEARAGRSDVQAQPIRGLDRAAVLERRVQLRAVAPDLVDFWAGAQAEKCIAWAGAASAVRLISAASSATFIPLRIFTPFPTCSSRRIIVVNSTLRSGRFKPVSDEQQRETAVNGSRR
jgi:hypothetical protein